MTRFLVRRIGFGALTVITVSLIVFTLFFVAPNDPARTLAGPQASFATVDTIRRTLGLDEPIVVQYWHFLERLLNGDLGFSYYNQQPVTKMILDALPVTASIALGAAVLMIVIGVLVGIGSARRPRSVRDRLTTVFVLTGLSIPTFVLGLLLLYVFFFLLTKAGLDWFPAAGYVPFFSDPLEWARHLILPWIAVALVGAATYARLSRSLMLDTLSEDFIRTARAKGVSEGRVVYKHALRSISAPLVTQFGLDLAMLLGGLVVTERVFGLPGIGSMAVTAVVRGDRPVIMGVVLASAIFLVVANILVDICYALLDSRVRLS
jgi:peptide/nickel transport system permease protein